MVSFGQIAACAFVVAGLSMLMALPASAQERIVPAPDNPWYWSYKGKKVLLLGGSDEDNLFNNPELMRDNLEKLVRCGGNYIRGTLSWRDKGNVPPFEKVGDKYDLRRPNPEFFRRLEECCRMCLERDIIVQIEVWATFDFYRDNWAKSPWNPANNVNYTTDNTRLQTTWDFHPAHKPQPFFFSVPELNNDKLLLQYQQAFVRKVLDVTLKYPNVLYCMDNETRAPEQWALYWGRFIHEEARRRGLRACTTEMWDPWNLTDPTHARTYSHPDVFDFCDVSQNNWNDGQTHYDRLIWFRDNLLKQPGGARPMNNVKIYGVPYPPKKPYRADPATNIERFWRIIFAGCASARFHRPTAGIGISEPAQKAIRAARAFTNAFDIFSCRPAPQLLSDREPNEAYCLANPPRLYAVYFPRGGQVVLKAERGRTYTVRWFDPDTAQFRDPQPLAGNGALKLTTPSRDKTWLVLIEAR